jgi:hypothetical protein
LVPFQYVFVDATHVEIEGANLRGEEMQKRTTYRIDWLGDGEVRLVDIHFGESFRLRR